MNNTSKIASIQLLRFLFAIGVVLGHIWNPITSSAVFPAGGKGVVFFLILSGYLSASSDTSDIKSYYWKKFKRIFPIHWIALFCAMVINLPQRSFWTISNLWAGLSSVFLIQSYIPDEAIYWSYYYNGPSWFLSIIVLFYLILPICQRLRTRSKLFFYLFTICMCIFSVTFSFVSKWSNWGSGVFPPVRVTECLLGMCLYDLRQHRIRIGMSAELSALAIYLIAVFILPLKGIGNLLWIPTMCIVIYVFANSHGFIASNSDNKIVSFLGAISMEIYIYQLISIRFVGTMLSFVPGGAVHIRFLMQFVLIFIVLFLTSIIYHSFIDPKIQKFLSRYDFRNRTNI